MIELIGILFGGASRLFQHWMDLREKQNERAHELLMYDKQIEMADKRHVHDAELRKMDGENAEAKAEWQAIMAAVEAQAREAAAAGGWVAKVSASIRPFLTIWHAVILYSVVKVALFYLATTGGLNWAQAVLEIYGPFDKAMVGSMVGFWFQDRALRRKAW
jgi:hypothetical protein